MTRSRLVICLVPTLLFLLGAQGSAFGAEENVAEALHVPLPMVDQGRRWTLTGNYDQPNNMMQEWVPQGETGRAWSEMVTMMTFKGLPNIDTGSFIVGIAERFQKSCAKFAVLKREIKNRSRRGTAEPGFASGI